MVAGKMIRTETVVKALRAEWRVQERLGEVESSDSLRERAIGAKATIKELAHALGVYDELFLSRPPADEE